MLQPEGRTGEVWESPNELMVFLLPIQEGGDSLFLSPSLSLPPFYCDLTVLSARTNDVLFNESYGTLMYAL